jgi:hypothetical protein
MRKLCLTLVVFLLATCGLARPAAAILQYQKEFVKLYVGEDADPESDLVKIKRDKKKRCLVCHQGKKKKICNTYGELFRPLLDRKKDKKNVEKIVAALKKVEQMRSDPKDENSPTYAEILAEGKLPGGTLEELMKEPPSKESEAK